MFRGINAINIDAKGRMAIPSRYRDCLVNLYASKLVITIDTESACLLIYPLNEWEVIEQKIQVLPSFNAQARRIQRLLIGHATDLEMDGNGRILIPPLLRAHADVEKKVMLVGQGKKFELWDEDNWHAQRDDWLSLEANNGGDMPDELRSLSL